MKKKVIAYLHTHWDREWYREFEIFRLRLLRVFDNVLDLLENKKIPAFYFDGQVSALLDYLEIRPGKETLIRKLIQEKKLFIGPCFTLVDEFLTDKYCFEKNLEIGLKISRNFGCEDFIGYLADTFGHSKNIPKIFKKYGIDKCVVWRGCGDMPAEFIFNGINTVNLIRGYFMDIFSAKISIEDKAKWLKGNLDKIAEKSGDVLLLPIGADHLGVEPDIANQIEEVNKLLNDYEIELSTPFAYFELVKDNFKYEWDDELRDNSKTFILQGSYSARTKIKQYNAQASFKLKLADDFQKEIGGKYDNSIDYAYKLLLKNQAHDGICGCSTDDVHQENIIRYKKVVQIAKTILKELKFLYPEKFEQIWLKLNESCRSTILREGINPPRNSQIISSKKGFVDEILYDTQRIPITEDYTTIYKYLEEIQPSDDNVFVCENQISNSKIHLKIENDKIIISDKVTIDFVQFEDDGDTYNFGAIENDNGKFAQIRGSEIIMDGSLRCGIKISTDFFDVNVYLDKNSDILRFKINWNNNLTNKLWQVRFNLANPITETYSEDMETIIKREFNPNYKIREHLPKTKGIEVWTNTAPMQRFVSAQGFGIVTKGLTEYEVSENSLAITLLRSTGIISNPKNPSRSTPAGPPLEVPEAQQLGENSAEFGIGFFETEEYLKKVNEIYLG